MTTGVYLERLNAASTGKDDERIGVLQKDGCVIYIGANAISNESIITAHKGLPHPECIVFHAFGAKGSYVILCSAQSGVFSDSTILFAAGIALKHSRSELKAVTYGFLRDLYKPDDAQPGVFRWATSGQMEL